mmetsp:Transcript_8915/g.22025  ORF Transcript_8915/g.22025 Transcript_8915/m.22025 type:complete len:222 (-) Transcript_8915:397-1062(-)
MPVGSLETEDCSSTESPPKLPAEVMKESPPEETSPAHLSSIESSESPPHSEENASFGTAQSAPTLLASVKAPPTLASPPAAVFSRGPASVASSSAWGAKASIASASVCASAPLSVLCRHSERRVFQTVASSTPPRRSDRPRDASVLTSRAARNLRAVRPPGRGFAPLPSCIAARTPTPVKSGVWCTPAWSIAWRSDAAATGEGNASGPSCLSLSAAFSARS